MTYCIHAILADVVFGLYDPSTYFGPYKAGPVIFTVRRHNEIVCQYFVHFLIFLQRLTTALH